MDVGGIFSFSAASIPVVLARLEEEVHESTSNKTKATTTAAKYWLSLYETGKGIFPALALIPASAHACNAIFSRDTSSVKYLLIGAVGFTIGIVPYTIILMGRLNATIAGFTSPSSSSVKKGEEEEDKDKEELVRLMKVWKWMNFGRASLPLVASVLAVWAAFL